MPKEEIITKRKIRAKRIVKGLLENKTLKEIGAEILPPETKNISQSVYSAIRKPAVQEEIRRNLKENGVWDLAKSKKEAIKQYEELSESPNPQNKAIAFRYKENLDKISGLMIEKQEVLNKREIGKIDLKTAKVEDLQAELLKRLQVNHDGVTVEPKPEETVEKTA